MSRFLGKRGIHNEPKSEKLTESQNLVVWAYKKHLNIEQFEQSKKGDPMLKKSLMIAALVAVAAPAHASCVIFPCKIKEDPIVEFVPKVPPQTPAGCAYRTASSSQNFCPAGLQPVESGGMISCGVPVAGEICHQPKAVKRVEKVNKSRIVCPVGEKGCYTTH